MQIVTKPCRFSPRKASWMYPTLSTLILASFMPLVLNRFQCFSSPISFIVDNLHLTWSPLERLPILFYLKVTNCYLSKRDFLLLFFLPPFLGQFLSIIVPWDFILSVCVGFDLRPTLHLLPVLGWAGLTSTGGITQAPWQWPLPVFTWSRASWVLPCPWS